MALETHQKHSLGRRAFFLFLSRKLKYPILFFAIAGAFWYAERWLPAAYVFWAVYLAEMFALAGVACLILVLILTYLEYRVYTYSFTEEAFVMTSGLAVRNEVAALYHQIQNVNISRSPFDRMIGVSQIVIFMTGAGREAEHTRIVLPAVGKHKAKFVQKELLVRARRHVPQAQAQAETEE